MISENFVLWFMQRSWMQKGISMKETILAAVLLLAASARAVAQRDTAWSQLYRRDLDSLHAAISANHPGAIDDQNPAFALTLERAYREARALAPKIKDFAAFRIGLMRFIDEFEDEHLQIGFTQEIDTVREAGIVVRWQSDAFLVTHMDKRYGNSRLVGTKVMMCEGIPARNLFVDRVLWWRGREKIESDWSRHAPLLFVDHGPPLPRAPRSCTFDAQGTRIIQQLQWRNTARTDFDAMVRGTQRAQPRELGVERSALRKLWVRLPTFSAHADPQLSAMRATIDSLRAFVAAQPNWELIVFDLRGNSGGSSTWGDEITRIVFGDEWAEQATSYLNDGVYTEWRLSADNLRSMRGMEQQIAKRDGTESASARSFRTFVDSAEAHFKRGGKYYGAPRTRTSVAPPAAAALPGKVVVITTAACFSACLDFMDRLRLHPAVVQVGQTTGVDTNYMENWGGPISDLTRWGHPLKVYRNRRRAMNEAYFPKVPYGASLEDDSAVRDWVLENFSQW
jgi:hypothetical protein